MPQQSLRIVAFSPSIISDIGNPQATSVRAMLDAFAALGCDVTHLEERNNSDLRMMLQTRGYRPMRSFNLTYPSIRYRFYDLPEGIHRSVWFSRELGTADAVVVWPGSPEPVLEEVAGFAARQIVRFWPDGTDAHHAAVADWFDPAAFPYLLNEGPMGPGLAVTWDQAFAVPPGTRLLNAGSEDLDGWEYIPEVELGSVMRGGETVWLSDETAPARIAQTVGRGAHVRLVNGVDWEDYVEVDDITDRENALGRAAILQTVIAAELVRRST